MMRWFLAVLLACAGCNDAPPPVQTGGVVDSIFPVEEEIRRFKAQLPGNAPAALNEAASSKEALAEAFIRAFETRDTAQLRALVLGPWEFIEFYYPGSEFSAPPYKQSPSTVWFLLQQNSEKGISRALTRFGGRPSGYRGLECSDSVRHQGPTLLWERCRVRWRSETGKPDPITLFGTILERGGRFKFVSYANEL